MELTSDLITLQGILSGVIKSTGDFTKIKYRGGSEMKISAVVEEIEKFLIYKEYLINETVNIKFKKQINEILLFFILNCDFKHQFETENSHLGGIIPKLSKCLLVNIVIDLNLTQCFSEILKKIPFNIQAELLNETVTSLKKSTPKVCLDTSYLLLREIIKHLNELNSSNTQQSQNINEVTDICKEMIYNLRGINVDQTTNMKSTKVYTHMGYTFLRVLDLLQMCDTGNTLTEKLLNSLIMAAATAMEAVTLDVFCVWAEIEDEGQPLQTLIAHSAYATIEKFQKHKMAKELIQMLGTIAKKPHSVQEQIRQANPSTMIAMIEKADANQSHWFHALTSTKIFSDKSSMNCVKKYANLCDDADLDRLLNMSVEYKEDEVKDVVLTCATVLDIEELIIVVTRYFYKFGIINNLDRGTTKQQLVIVMNKMKKDDGLDINSAFTKEITLLLLQNAQEVLQHLFGECLKSCAYTNCLKQLFDGVKEIVAVHGLGLRVLKDVLDKSGVLNENFKEVVQLLKVLVQTGCVSGKNLTEEYFLQNFEKCLMEAKFLDLRNLLYVFNEISILEKKLATENLLSLVLTIAKSTRCDFFTFDRAKHNVVEQCVRLLFKVVEFGIDEDNTPNLQSIDLITNYYMEKIVSPNKTFFEYLFAEVNLDEHYKLVTALVKVLPSCVSKEWSSIVFCLQAAYGYEKVVAILTDVMVILSQVAKNQNDNSPAFAALQCCVQNYSIVFKELMQSKGQNLECEIALTKSIFRILRELPQSILQEDGITFTGLATDASLQNLAQDRNFVCGLLGIADGSVRQVLAARMMKK